MKTWKIFVIIVVAVALIFIMVKVAFGETAGQKLSREEQIRIMDECYKDARIAVKMRSFNSGRGGRLEISLAFFYYRTGMLPIVQ